MTSPAFPACTFPLRERPWPEALEVIARAGYRKVDLLGRAPHLTLDPAECDPAAIRAAAAGLGLEVANLGTYAGRGFATTTSPRWRRSWPSPAGPSTWR